MRIVKIVALLLAAVVLLGMGGLGGAPEGSVPETGENVQVRVTDRQGVSTELRQFSVDGKAFLSGARGSGTVSIPFNRVVSVEFGVPAGDLIPVQVQLGGGERVLLQIERRAVFYGNTGYGAYQVRAQDLRRIDFRPSPAS